MPPSVLACQRGNPSFIVRICSVHHIWGFYLHCMRNQPAPQACPSSPVLLCANPGNPARNKCLKNIIRVQIWFSPAADLEGSLFVRLWRDGGTNPKLCTRRHPGVRGGGVGSVWQLLIEGAGSHVVVFSSVLWVWQGLLKPRTSGCSSLLCQVYDYILSSSVSHCTT